MRTSKNRRRVAAEQDIRALAGLPVGRVGSLFSSASLRLSLLLCFSVYTSSRPPLFSPSRNISLARPFHLPRYLSLPPPFARSPPSNESLLLRPFYYSYYFHTPPPYVPTTAPSHHRTGGHFPLLGPPPLLLAPRKMRILIRYCLILFMYACAREPAHFKPFPSHPCRLGPPLHRRGEESGVYPRDESTPCAAFGPSSTTLSTAATIPSWLIFHADFSVLRGKYSWNAARSNVIRAKCVEKNVSKRERIG